MYDAVWTYAKALNDLDSLQSLGVQPLNCMEPTPWVDGDNILSYLRKIIMIYLFS
jgi:hypothetical protein